MKRIILNIFIFYFSMLFSDSVRENYWLIIGTYRQGLRSRPKVSGITSPSLYSIPMNRFDSCNKAGHKIYKPVWQFDSKWNCVFSGDKSKFTV